MITIFQNSKTNFEVKKVNLYESVADRLEDMIFDDTLKIGDRLPSEQSLADNFRVSRNIVREALKILKERGLLEVKNGDGAYVIKPDAALLRGMVGRFIILGDIETNHVYEMRLALEGPAAAYAALRATEEDIVTLERIVSDMNDNIGHLEHWVQHDLLFHTTIAKASGNPLFFEFIKSMTDSLSTLFEKGYHVPGATKEGLQKHYNILQAIKERNPKLAEFRMNEHLTRSARDQHATQTHAEETI